MPSTVTPPNGPTDLTGTSVGRFQVHTCLGTGGQGEVYAAEDTRLKRQVALKRLAPHLRRDERYRQELLREAQRASGLHDQHIAGIYDVLETEGEMLLVMEYVEGVTLRQRLRHALSIEEFLEIAIQCAQALVAAHEHGVVHRDIKPDNVMLTRTGRVKVLDFGVAKRRAEHRAGETTDAEPGELVGTPAYMAPEVLLETPSDDRADIFSLGVVLYEALAGRHPFLSHSFVATADRILNETPPALERVNPTVPPELASIVERMIAKKPVDRYANARDLLAELEEVHRQHTEDTSVSARFGRWLNRHRARLAMVTAVLLVSGALTAWYFQIRKEHQQQRSAVSAALPLPDKKYIAVLPFHAIDPSQRAFADGLTETMTAKLTQLTAGHALQVVPAAEIRARKITDAGQARKELGVNLVLEGSLHMSGNSVRVAYTLVDTESRQQLRAGTLTADAGDPFGMEDRTVEGVLRMLEVETRPAERETLASYGTEVAGAYDYYLRGLGLLQGENTIENIDGALEQFQHALALDARYAPAHAGIGEAYWEKYELTKQAEWVDRARLSCERASSLNSKLAEAHICLGILNNGRGQYEAAVKEFQSALAAEPTSDAAYIGLGEAYQQLGRPKEAEATYLQAIKLRPHYWAGYGWLANFYSSQARYADAAAQLERAAAIVPGNSSVFAHLGGIYIFLGRYQDAISVLQRSIELRPSFQAYSNLGTAYLNLRAFDKAIPALEQAVALDSQEYRARGNLARAYYWTPGQRERAYAAYQKAIELAQQRLKVNPQDGDAHILLADFNAMLGHRSEALRHLNEALHLRPEDPEFAFFAAVVYDQLGQLKDARSWLDKAIERGYSRSDIDAAIELDNLRGEQRPTAQLDNSKR